MKKLTVEDICVPEVVERAVRDWANRHGYVGDNGHMSEVYMNCARIALLALAETPIVPSEDEIAVVWKRGGGNYPISAAHVSGCLVEWQRLMFLKPKPELPEEVKALLVDRPGTGILSVGCGRHDEAVIAAYKLGLGQRNKEDGGGR